MDMYLETGGLSSPEGASDPTLRTAVAYQTQQANLTLDLKTVPQYF